MCKDSIYVYLLTINLPQVVLFIYISWANLGQQKTNYLVSLRNNKILTYKQENIEISARCAIL